MFLAGCVLLVLSRRERSQERKRWDGESSGWETIWLLAGVTYPHLIAVEPRWPKPSTTSAPRWQSLFWSEFSKNSLPSVYLRDRNAPAFAEVTTCQKPPDGDLDEDRYVVSRCW